jgi:glutathione peroxidase
MAEPFPYDLPLQTLAGETRSLEALRGKVLLIVNTASKCGFTPQYEGLEALYRAHRDAGLEVLGFPCNQFGHQEPGDAGEIQSFCSTRFDLSFPLFAKIDVNGPDTHPLYRHLKRARPGLLGTEAVKWNFTKFLVGRDGTVLKRFAPTDTPASIERALVEALEARA